MEAIDMRGNHPELLPGEVFLTNASDSKFSRVSLLGHNDTRSSYEMIGWRTKRKGVIAYDINGRRMSKMFPVFVQREELIKGGINPDNLWDK